MARPLPPRLFVLVRTDDNARRSSAYQSTHMQHLRVCCADTRNAPNSRGARVDCSMMAGVARSAATNAGCRRSGDGYVDVRRRRCTRVCACEGIPYISVLTRDHADDTLARLASSAVEPAATT
jgi:hypothetical protein